MSPTRFINANENSIEFMKGCSVATVTFSQAKYSNRIRTLAARFPDQVNIVADGEQNNGYLYARIPVSWIKINPPKNMTDEQRDALREHAKAMQKSNSSNS